MYDPGSIVTGLSPEFVSWMPPEYVPDTYRDICLLSKKICDVNHAATDAPSSAGR
jgi:hypothetical protein